MNVWVLHLGYNVEDGAAVFTDLQAAKDCAFHEISAISIDWERLNGGLKWIGVAECKPLSTVFRQTVYIFGHTVDERTHEL